jgi:hypothetical protein
MLGQVLPEWDRIGIDTEEDWRSMTRAAKTLTRSTIFESVLLPRWYVSFLRQYTTVFVRVDCDEEVRQARLAERGWPSDLNLVGHWHYPVVVDGTQVNPDDVDRIARSML